MPFEPIDLAKIQKQLDDWNRRHPAGTKVAVKGYVEAKFTRTEALILFRQKAVIYLEGHNGYFDLEEVTPSTEQTSEPASFDSSPRRDGVCFMFPGQGSQSQGMGSDLFDAYPEYTRTASQILGYSIQELCLRNPDGLLDRTDHTQPSLFVVNALSWLREREHSGSPEYLIGHSLGEYNALFAAGVFDFETGLKLVQKRGSLMAAAGGGMAAVLGLSRQAVDRTLNRSGLASLDIANINAPEQIVISGPKSDIEAARTFFESAGATLYLPLNVSAAFHSRLMEPAETEFRSFINNFSLRPPTTIVISNLEALPYSGDRVAELLSGQITGSVNWLESIRFLMNRGVTSFREVGPGKTLTGLVTKIQNAVAAGTSA